MTAGLSLLRRCLCWGSSIFSSPASPKSGWASCFLQEARPAAYAEKNVLFHVHPLPPALASPCYPVSICFPTKFRNSSSVPITGPGIGLVPSAHSPDNHRPEELMEPAAQPDAFWNTALPVPFQRNTQNAKNPPKKGSKRPLLFLSLCLRLQKTLFKE
jgi:hypothetical protein